MKTAEQNQSGGTPPAFEARCRTYYLAQDRGVYRTGIVLLAMPIILFAYSDFVLYQTGPMFRLLCAVRLVFLAATVVVFFAMSRLANFNAADALLVVWSLLLCTVVIFINSTRPPTYIQHAMLDVLILMTLYFMFPLPSPLHAIAPIAFTLGNLIMMYVVKTSISPLETYVLIITYALGNALGLYTAGRMQRYRREHFRAFNQEQDLRVELEEALLNLKTLQGMLPICSHCKKIRDDQGSWTQMEHYIRSHSKADFTHGICPECIEEHFGDVEMVE